MNELYFYSGQIHYHLGNYDSSIHYMKKALAINPKNSFEYFRIGQSYLYIKDSKEAIIWLNKYVQMNPLDMFGHAYLGLAYEENAHFLKAENEYKEAMSKDQEAYLPLFFLGRMYYKQRKDTEALKFLDVSIELQEKNKKSDFIGESYYYRSMLKFRLGNREGGCKDIEISKAYGFEPALLDKEKGKNDCK